MSAKNKTARLFASSLIFFPCTGWKKQETIEPFNWKQEVTSRRGYDYEEGNGYEELDTGRIVSRLTTSEDGKTKHTTIKQKRNQSDYRKQKEKRQTYKDNLVESKVEYLDDEHISKIETENQTINFTYDSARNLTSVLLNGQERVSVTHDGNVARYEYANGTNTEVTFPDNTHVIVESESRNGTAQLDGDGNLLGRSDTENSIFYSYGLDEYGNAASWTAENISFKQSEEESLLTAYGGSLKQIFRDDKEDYNESKTDYSTDSDSATYKRRYYDAKETNLINEQILTETDSSERESGFETFNSPFGEKTYFYDQAGRLIEERIDNQRRMFQYDEMGRITEVIYGTGDERYEYDNAGNIVSRVSSSGTEYSYGYSNSYDRNQRTAADGQMLSYDDYGNLENYGNRSFSWDTGSFRKECYNGEENIRLGYTPDGIRALKLSDSGNLTFYGYNEGKLRVSYSTKKGLLLYGYDGNGIPKAVSYNGKLFFFVHDPLGNIEGLVDSHGERAVEYSYSTWGVPEVAYAYNEGLAEANQIIYKDYVYDWDRGLYYLSTRYYSPILRRFISRDDLVRISGNGLNDPCYNLYVYALDNPISFSDKSGCLAVEVAAATIYEAIAGIALAVLAIILLEAVMDYSRQNFPSSVLSTGLVDKTKWDLYRAIKEVGEIIIFTTSLVTLTSWSKWIRRNRNPEKHHIIAQHDFRAFPARHVWIGKCDNKIYTPPNVIPLKYELHRHIHTREYFRAVNHEIVSAYEIGFWIKGNPENEVYYALFDIYCVLQVLNQEAPF